MSTVSSSSHLGGLITVNVGDNDLGDLQLVHFSVRLNVAQQVQESLGGLLWPTNLVSRSLILLANSVSANASSVLGEWDSILVLQHILQVALSLGQRHSLDSMTDLTAMLEVNSQVSTSGLGSLGSIINFFTVLDHLIIARNLYVLQQGVGCSAWVREPCLW